jgi:hypothetical protein
VLRHLSAVGVGAILLVALAACTMTRVQETSPAASPSDEAVALGGEATGPVTLLGSGGASELGWRYVIYESADGWCTELQMAERTSTSCGPDLEPAEGDVIGSVGALEPLESGITPVEGVVTDDIVTVWIVDEVRGRVRAPLMPLDDAGLEGQAFLGFTPPGWTPTHIQALAMSGEILQTYELP